MDSEPIKMELTLEQQFHLFNVEQGVKQADSEMLQKWVVELTRQIMLKDNFTKGLMRSRI